VNDAYCWYFNTERADLMGRFMPFVYVDDLQKVRAHFASLRSEDNPVGAIEYRVRRPDDSVRWQQWITLPMFDKLGNLVEIQAIGRDITRRKELG
jgi:PAS domain S-box-containing protein